MCQRKKVSISQFFILNCQHQDDNMGLDLVSKDRKVEIFRGAYSAFSRFRCMMVSLVLDKPFEKIWRAHAFSSLGIRLPGSNNPESIETYLPNENDELGIFMYHSDCDGSWTPKECRIVSRMLKRVLDKTLKLKSDDGHIGKWHDTTAKFIRGLRYCAKKNQRALFS